MARPLLYSIVYAKGGAINNRRVIRSDQQQVQFRYRDHNDNRTKVMTLTIAQFIERVLSHVAESKQHTVRHYGLYHQRAKAKRQHCRSELSQAPESDKLPRISWESFLKDNGNKKAGKCTTCGQTLQRCYTWRNNRNSLYKVPIDGSVQQVVQRNIASGFVQGAGPPTRLQ